MHHRLQAVHVCVLPSASREVMHGIRIPLPDSVTTMSEAATFVRSYDHEGSNAACAWKAMRGGQLRFRRWKCIAHQQCTVILTARTLHQGGVSLYVTEGEHAAIENLFDRSNASLTRLQKREVSAARRWGATSRDMRKEHQDEAVQKAKRAKTFTTCELAAAGDWMVYLHVSLGM